MHASIMENFELFWELFDPGVRPKQQQTLPYADYYAKFGTTEELNGWQRKFIAEEQRTVYVKVS